mgnify:CR=1 FL=1
MVETVLLLYRTDPPPELGVVIQERKYGFRDEYSKILIPDLMKMGFAVLVGQLARELLNHFSLI